MLEKQFRLLGFSKKFMGDKSSYWWEKKIGKELILVIDVGFNIYYLDHEEWRWDNRCCGLAKIMPLFQRKIRI